MAHAPVLDKHILRLLPEDLDNIDILDVASGLGSWGYQIRTRARGVPRITSLDVWIPYIECVYPLNIYNSMVCADARKLPFRDNSFSVILACEVMEHLKQNEGIDFLDELERVAREMLIVTTPLGFMHQGNINGNMHERHISAWQKEDLEKKGYSVKIIDSFPLPKTLKLADKIRRWIFRLSSSPKEIIAIKSFIKTNF